MAPTPSVQSSPPAQARPASFVLAPYRWAVVDLPATTPASTCATGADGTEAAPSFAPSASASPGWWTGLLCAYGHTSWSTLSIKANRSLTLEVTAQDELGSATILKAMPVIGLWNVTDARGTIPTVATTPPPFNGTAYGMPTLSLQSAQPRQFRIAIADQRGDGRPDFSYQARALYADSISPATISAAGGVVTITGMGFRPGNAVTVNGVAATVSSWSATSIVATVPSLHTLHSTEALIANVAVNDLVTGGTTVMSSALTYAAPQPSLNLIAAPSGTVFVGDTAATPFSVQVLNGDGVTPIPGQAVVISASGASVRLGSCGTPTCTLLTDASGTASTTVTPLAPGSITLSAASTAGSASASFTATTRIRTLTAINSVQYLAPGSIVVWAPQVSLSDNSGPTAGVDVQWQATSGAIFVASGHSQANASGIAQTSATTGPLAPATQATVSACAWTTVCATLTARAVRLDDLRIVLVSGAGQSVNASSNLSPVILQVTDTAANPVAGAVVQIYQTIDAWQPPCDKGRCPIVPTYGSSTSSVTSNVDGLITIPPMQLAGTPPRSPTSLPSQEPRASSPSPCKSSLRPYRPICCL